MKAMILEKTGRIENAPLRLTEVPKPEAREGELRLKVSCCAICRTDIHVIEGELPVQKLPIIPGHQVVGIVDQLGKGCARFRIGDRVGVAWLRSTCGVCEYCRSGQENLCENQRFTGYHADGGYAEYCTVREDFAYRIPEGIDDLHAAPLLCAGIIGYRALQRSRLPNGGTLAIFGFGSSAHLVIQLAHHRGARVFVVTRGEKHRQLATKMGAEWVGEDFREMPNHVDSAILFAPVGTLVPQALSVLKRGGTLAVAGIYLSEIPPLDYEKHLFYEKNLCSVTANIRQDGVALLAEAARLRILPHLITYPLEQANRALLDLKMDRIEGTGVLKIDHASFQFNDSAGK